MAYEFTREDFDRRRRQIRAQLDLIAARLNHWSEWDAAQAHSPEGQSAIPHPEHSREELKELRDVLLEIQRDLEIGWGRRN
jgi:hypothetical protein